MFRSGNTSKVPQLDLSIEKSNNSYKKMVEQALETNMRAVKTMKGNADSSRRALAEPSCFKEGQLVLMDQIRGKKIHNKFMDRYSSVQFKVLSQKGSMVTVVNSEGRQVTREASWFKRGSPANERWEREDSVPGEGHHKEVVSVAAPEEQHEADINHAEVNLQPDPVVMSQTVAQTATGSLHLTPGYIELKRARKPVERYQSIDFRKPSR